MHSCSTLPERGRSTAWGGASPAPSATSSRGGGSTWARASTTARSASRGSTRSRWCSTTWPRSRRMPRPSCAAAETPWPTRGAPSCSSSWTLCPTTSGSPTGPTSDGTASSPTRSSTGSLLCPSPPRMDSIASWGRPSSTRPTTRGATKLTTSRPWSGLLRTTSLPPVPDLSGQYRWCCHL